METWMIVLLVALALLVVWLVTRKKTVDTGTTPTALTYTMIPETPGVDPQNGTPIPNPPPPPPPDVKAPVIPPIANGIIQRALKPSATLSQIPIAGRPIVAASKLPAQIANTAVDKLNSVQTTAARALEHIPVAGKVLAAPLAVGSKVTSGVSNVAKKLTSWL
jgi:hypothetical protein